MSVPDRQADENVVFTGEMPSNSYLRAANLSYSHLERVNLRDARLWDANLEGAD